MEYLKFILAALALTSGAFYLAGDMKNSTSDAAIYKSYVMWKAEFNKNFNAMEDEYRFDVFKSNYLFIAKAKSEGETTLGLNMMADLTNEEYI
jgi:hypothetical protein